MTKTFKKLRLGIKEAHSVDDITRAVEIAKKSSGNYSGAVTNLKLPIDNQGITFC